MIATQTLRPICVEAGLRADSGDILNKCSQCDFASSQAGRLRTQLKTHSEEKRC